jgi:hypothetical protein
MSMTANLSPDAPLPPGASGSSTWEDWDNKFRVIHTEARCANAHDCMVYGSALQFPDGHVDDGTLADPPGICVDFDANSPLTTDQARELAALIVSTADELDGWAKP